jgi:hypothetical protein
MQNTMAVASSILFGYILPKTLGRNWAVSKIKSVEKII